MNKDLVRSVKFTLFSVSAGVIQIGSFTLLNELLHLDYWVSYLIALILSVLWNFTLNRRYTFQSANNVPLAMLKVAAFYLVFTPASTLLENWLTTGHGWNEYLVTAINMVLNFVLEFLYDRFLCSVTASIPTSLQRRKTKHKNDRKKRKSAKEDVALLLPKIQKRQALQLVFLYVKICQKSDGAFNLIGTEASCTDVDMARGTVNDCFHALHVGFPRSVSASMGMGDLNAERNTLAANIALCQLLHLQS